MVEPALKLVIGVYGTLSLATVGFLAFRSGSRRTHVRTKDFSDRLESWWWINSAIGIIFISGNLIGSLLFAFVVSAGIVEIWITRPRKESWVFTILFSLFVGCTLAPICVVLATGGFPERALVAVIVLLTQLNDIYQYSIGKVFGKRALAPKISPAKTVAGAVGGVFLTTMTSLLITPHITVLDSVYSLGLGIGIGVSGIFGDLGFSLVKRRRGIKDFGHLLPGQGGLLDRLDSLTLVAPMLLFLI
ncbi:MAG: phosphatidate cytidylyltransferase [Verrucomicrobiota bacterium]